MLKHAIKIDPTYIDSYINSAKIFEKSGLAQTALLYYDEALKRNPNAAEVYYYKSKILSDFWKKQEAIEYLHTAAKLCPANSVLYLSKIGEVYESVGDKTQSLKYFKKVFDLARTQGLSTEFTKDEIDYINKVLNCYISNNSRQFEATKTTLDDIVTAADVQPQVNTTVDVAHIGEEV